MVFSSRSAGWSRAPAACSASTGHQGRPAPGVRVSAPGGRCGRRGVPGKPGRPPGDAVRPGRSLGEEGRFRKPTARLSAPHPVLAPRGWSAARPHRGSTGRKTGFDGMDLEPGRDEIAHFIAGLQPLPADRLAETLPRGGSSRSAEDVLDRSGKLAGRAIRKSRQSSSKGRESQVCRFDFAARSSPPRVTMPSGHAELSWGNSR